MRNRNYFKLFMIYVYEFFKGNQAKIYNEIVTQQNPYDHEFITHTNEENNKFLMDWRRKNHIRMGDYNYYPVPKMNENKIPIFIEKKVKERVA